MRSYWRAFSFPRQGRSGSLHSARHKRSVREFIGGIPFVQPCSLVAAAQTHASRPCGRLHYMFHSIIESELQFSHTGSDVSRAKQSIYNFSLFLQSYHMFYSDNNRATAVRGLLSTILSRDISAIETTVNRLASFRSTVRLNYLPRGCTMRRPQM